MRHIRIEHITAAAGKRTPSPEAQLAKCFLQTDERLNAQEAWPTAKFPQASSRYFRECGCLVTSIFNMLALHGLCTYPSPWELHEALKRGGAYYETANLELGALQGLLPIAYAGRSEYHEEALRARIGNAGEMFLLEAKGVQHARHFILPFCMEDGGIMVFDPLRGRQPLSAYEEIYSLVCFLAQTE